MMAAVSAAPLATGKHEVMAMVEFESFPDLIEANQELTLKLLQSGA